ncbi:MAG: hypothetical protein QXI19_12275, partial [Candidatus Caldarchaeum sp.]
GGWVSRRDRLVGVVADRRLCSRSGLAHVASGYSSRRSQHCLLPRPGCVLVIARTREGAVASPLRAQPPPPLLGSQSQSATSTVDVGRHPCRVEVLSRTDLTAAAYRHSSTTFLELAFGIAN